MVNIDHSDPKKWSISTTLPCFLCINQRKPMAWKLIYQVKSGQDQPRIHPLKKKPKSKCIILTIFLEKYFLLNKVSSKRLISTILTIAVVILVNSDRSQLTYASKSSQRPIIYLLSLPFLSEVGSQYLICILWV